MEDPATDPRRTLGATGEALAADLLRGAGYRILARNVRADGVEIDLVVRRGPELAFVEVKTRRSPRHGGALLALGPRQQQRLIRAAAAWLRANPQRGARVRFDLVAIDADHDGTLCARHLPGAFDASG